MMGDVSIADSQLTLALSQRLRLLRQERGWSLEQLAVRAGSSRATLSRIEAGEVSPTTQTLAGLCRAFGVRMSALLHAAESALPNLAHREDQPVWRDADNGFERRAVLPYAAGWKGEVVDVTLEAGRTIRYASPPSGGLEHYLVMLAGALLVTLDDSPYELVAGDALRYRLTGASQFETRRGEPARYLLFLA